MHYRYRVQGRRYVFCNGGGGGGIIAGAEGTSLVGGSNFEARKRELFSALMRYVSEKSISPSMKMANNCKSLYIIKITESKENQFIHRLDLSGSTGSEGQLPPR